MSDTNGAKDAVKADEVVEAAREQAEKARAELQDFSREIRQRANDARKEVVKQLHTAAETIRKEARENKGNDEMKNAADNLANGLERAANYLNSRNVEDMGDEVVKVVRRNPTRVMMILFVVGVIVGVFLRRDSHQS